MRFSNVAAFVGVTVLLAITARCSAGQVDATVNLQPSQTYQTITGWEATAQAGQFECSSFLSYRDELLDRAVDELGVNRVRLEVKSGFENTTDYAQRFLDGQIDFAGWHQGFYEIVNDNGDPHSINWNGFKFTGVDYVIENVVLPLKQRLQARGENLFVNVNYVDFKTYTGLHNQNPEEYAEFVLATYLHMQQKYGLVPDAWEVILEPDNSTWTGTQIGQAIAAAAARLQANGFSPSFIAPSTVSMNRASKFIDDMMAVQGAKPYVREFSYHRYKEVSTTALNNIAQRAQQHGKQTAMLEHIGSGYEDLHEDLKVGMNSAWSQYTLAFCESPNTGAKYYNILNSAPYVQLAGHTHLLRHYFRYVRAGARRIGASSTRNEVDPLAFVNTDGKQVVVLKANSAANVTINGLPNGRYGVRFTEYQDPKSYNQNHSIWANLGEVQVSGGGSIQVAIPKKGVVTVHALSGGGGSTGSARLTPSPNSLSFGSVNAGGSKTMDVRIENPGDATLTISTISASPAAFSASPTSGSVAPGGSMTVEVTFSPNGGGTVNGALQISSNGVGSPHQVTLSGTGVSSGSAAVSTSPSRLTFGQVDVGTTRTLNVQIENPGDATLAISDIVATPAVFTATPRSGTVAAGETMTVQVTFAPAIEGTVSGTLEIVSNGAGSPHQVSLAGSGTLIDTSAENPQAHKYGLEQNFPNPFTGFTQFRYEVAATGPVRLQIFDATGRLVCNLVDRQHSPGTYVAGLDTTGWSSGVYLVRMIAGDFVQVRRMALVR